MSIDTSGKWWVGSEPADVEAYLRAFSADGYPVGEFRLSRCECGGLDFELEVADGEGARRSCSVCGASQFIGDSAEFWDEAEPERWSCVECHSLRANAGVGFALRSDGEVRWIYVGYRCAQCGVLGCCAEWKIDYAPSRLLLDQA